MKTTVTLFFIAFTSFFNAQIEFNHSVAYSILITSETGYTQAYPGGITYNPRLDFVLHKEFSLSLTTYPTIASFPSEGLIGVSMPIMGQINFGHHASQNAESSFGMFFGYGYSIGAFSESGVLAGKCLTAGIKFGGDRRSFGLRFELTNCPKNYKGDRDRVIGLGLLYNFQR